MTEEITTSNTAIITTQEMVNCCTESEMACMMKSKGVPMLDGAYDPTYFITREKDIEAGIVNFSWEKMTDSGIDEQVRQEDS